MLNQFLVSFIRLDEAGTFIIEIKGGYRDIIQFSQFLFRGKFVICAAAGDDLVFLYGVDQIIGRTDIGIDPGTVSYTHLDVYKRQV